MNQYARLFYLAKLIVYRCSQLYKFGTKRDVGIEERRYASISYTGLLFQGLVVLFEVASREKLFILLTKLHG